MTERMGQADCRSALAKGSEMKRKDKSGENSDTNKEQFFAALFEHWSSHPASLEKQKTVWLWLGLSPLALLAIFAVFAFSSMDGVVALFRHPGLWLKIAGALLSLSLGATLTFAVLSLMARGAFKRNANISGADSWSVSMPMVALLAFFWVVPAILSFLGRLWGGQLAPGPVMFLLNLLCFAPFVILLLWVQVATEKDKPGKCRPVWCILGTVFLALMVLALLDTVPSFTMRTAFAGFLSKCGINLDPELRKGVLFATLLPVSLACYAVWLLFRRTMDASKGAGKGDAKNGESAPDGGKKGLFRRFWDWLFGRDEAPEPQKKPSGPQVPSWVYDFINNIPEGIELESRKAGEPDLLEIGETSDYDMSEEGNDLAFLMTGEVVTETGTGNLGEEGANQEPDEEKPGEGMRTTPDGEGVEDEALFRPTQAQTRFFHRFREAYDDALKKGADGVIVSPDMILGGDEGTGRSEVLRACAVFAAFSRGQHVLYIVPDQRQAEVVRDKIRDSVARMMLSGYLTCDILDAEKVIGWMKGVMVGEEGFSGQPIPTILVATPRAVEGFLFDNDRANDENSYNQLRHVIQSFEVILLDDFMELDATERAHMTFVVHKFQTLLAYKRVLSQIVVVMPRLLDDVGVSEVGDKLFGQTQFNSNNYLTLKPRPLPGGHGAWKLPLRVTNPSATPADACNVLVRKCLELGLDVVMYRKGITIHQCEKVKGELSHGIESGTLTVISRLDQLSSPAEPDAVFYLAALSGDAGLSLRLNFGGSQSVFIRIAGPDDIGFERTDVVPILPGNTAIALRIHHLKSLLRLITPNEPLPEAFWMHFGLTTQGGEIATVKRATNLVPSVEWGVDTWNDPEAYGEPLAPYIFLTETALASNAGVRIRFSSLPLLKENVFRLNGEDRLILGVARAPENEAGGEDDVALGAPAEWVEMEGGRPLAGCDLSHVERLVLARSDDGEFSGKPSENVLTVERFAKGNATCCAQMTTRHWNGDGSDYDTPVRSLAWNIEPVVEPKIYIHADECTFMAFDLPESRGIPRNVEASIPRRLNQNGLLSKVSPPARYRYPAYHAALVFLPRRMDSSNTDAYVQRFVAGSWTTDDASAFSPVMTHVFGGVMRRFIPDFPFFAACPAFSGAERDNPIGEMVIWILEPTNSGKSLHAILERFFGSGRGPVGNPLLSQEKRDALTGVTATRLVATMDEVVRRAKTFGTPSEKLRWLRAFSGVAFEFPLETEQDKRRFEADFAHVEKVLAELGRRLREGYQPGAEDEMPPLPVNRPGDTSWIVKPKSMDGSIETGVVEWTSVGTLPDGFSVGAGKCSSSWVANRKSFDVQYGFSDEKMRKAYDDFLNGGHWTFRISQASLAEYGENDPYREALDALYSKLEGMFLARGNKKDAKKDQKIRDREMAEFLLAFVQGGVEYIKDPKLPGTDWPRFPSETLVHKGVNEKGEVSFGGDCEDSSILYMELLRRAGIESAYLHVPRHAAVGVYVEMTRTARGREPVAYQWLGKKYVYAETATDMGSYVPLGEETELIPSADAIPADVTLTEPRSPGENVILRILNVRYDKAKDGVVVSVLGTDGLTASASPLVLACFARPRKGVFDPPDESHYRPLAVVNLPVPGRGEVREAFISLASPDYPSWWLDVFACESESGTVRGHFVGVMKFVRKK